MILKIINIEIETNIIINYIINNYHKLYFHKFIFIIL